MKLFLTLLLTMFFTSVHAGDFYAGGMYGFSNLNYDIESEGWKEIANNKTAAQINGIVQTLDGNVNIDSNKTSTFQKVFVGYRVSKNWGVEVFQFKMDNYELTANAEARYNPRYAVNGKYGGASAYANGNVNANAKAYADFGGYGVRVNGYLPFTENFELIAGLGVIKAKSNMSYSYNIDGSWSAGAEGNVNKPLANYDAGIDYNGTYTDSGSGVDSYDGYGPVFSLGMIYNFTKMIAVRAEVELYGIPVDGISITTTSVGMQFSF